jgi:hypothetical protein
MLASLLVVPNLLGLGPYPVFLPYLLFCFLGFGLGLLSPSESILLGISCNAFPCSVLSPSEVDSWMISGA